MAVYTPVVLLRVHPVYASMTLGAGTDSLRATEGVPVPRPALPPLTSLGVALRTRRTATAADQHDAASEIGVPQATLSRLERGKHRPSADTACRRWNPREYSEYPTHRPSADTAGPVPSRAGPSRHADAAADSSPGADVAQRRRLCASGPPGAQLPPSGPMDTPWQPSLAAGVL